VGAKVMKKLESQKKNQNCLNISQILITFAPEILVAQFPFGKSAEKGIRCKS
jgi:hypothetical protein